MKQTNDKCVTKDSQKIKLLVLTYNNSITVL